MEKRTAHIPSISCRHCVMTITREISELEGVKSVEGDENTKMVTVEWDNPVTWDKIVATFKETGYPVEQ